MKWRKKRFNWALYESLRQVEREEAFRLLKWAVDSLPPPWDSGWKGIGRKPYDSRALTVVTIWQEIEGKPERAYTADLERDKEHLRMLGLKHAPHRTALYRTRKRLSEEYMRRLNRKILERLKPARKLGVDATGLRQSRRDCAWSSASDGGRRGYVKLHGLFNMETRAVENFEATPGTVHECNRLEGLLAKLDNIECLVADAGYLSRRNCRLVAEKGGKPYIKPKRNSQQKAKGCWPWKSMVTLFRKHPRVFNRFYKLHPRVEAAWRSLKSLVGDIVRSRTIQNIKAEIWSKITCYNLIWTIRGKHGF
ncbi:MAG: transposase [Thermoproteota archaeon]|nr:transposase [Thermoproteota archaeon]